jgi:hypothetical protein
MFVMQCILPEVAKKSEAPQHAREPASKKQRLSSVAPDPRASAVLVSRATCYAKLLEEPLAGSASADTKQLASVLFRTRGTFHYKTNGDVLRETPCQQEQYTQVGLILEVLQAAREYVGGKRRIAKRTRVATTTVA